MVCEGGKNVMLVMRGCNDVMMVVVAGYVLCEWVCEGENDT